MTPAPCADGHSIKRNRHPDGSPWVCSGCARGFAVVPRLVNPGDEGNLRLHVAQLERLIVSVAKGNTPIHVLQRFIA